MTAHDVTFLRNRRTVIRLRSRRLVLVGCVLQMLGWLTGPVGARSVDDLTELPNLAARPIPYVDIAFGSAPGVLPVDVSLPVDMTPPPDDRPRILRLTARTANVGTSALDVLGRPTADPLTLDALQCIQWAAIVCRERTRVGNLLWHEAHRHWHFNDFALYELRRWTSDGGPDMGASGLVSTGTKASFCLEDTDRDQAGGPIVGFYKTCSGLLQGISPAWADEYSAELPGQHLSLEGVTDGLYAVVLSVDPADRLLESDETDNTAWSVIEISNNVTSARVIEQ